MLFKEILDQKLNSLKPEFDNLYEDVLDNQTHDCDLLLALKNGHYELEDRIIGNPPIKLSPFVIGPNLEGHSEILHYKFIKSYLDTSTNLESFKGYLDQFIFDHSNVPEERKRIDALEEKEGITIQLEMLIYLKIWEADTFIKKYYQISGLLSGQDYDWEFRIEPMKKVKGDPLKYTGRRQAIIGTVIDALKPFPLIYNTFENAYRKQIRNAIAHSQYYFHGRSIGFNNYDKNDKSSIKGISFDEWIEIFHDTLALYKHYLRFFGKASRLYADFAAQHGNILEVRLQSFQPSYRREFNLLEYDPNYHDWHWHHNK